MHYAGRRLRQEQDGVWGGVGWGGVGWRGRAVSRCQVSSRTEQVQVCRGGGYFFIRKFGRLFACGCFIFLSRLKKCPDPCPHLLCLFGPLVFISRCFVFYISFLRCLFGGCASPNYVHICIWANREKVSKNSFFEYSLSDTHEIGFKPISNRGNGIGGGRGGVCG